MRHYLLFMCMRLQDRILLKMKCLPSLAALSASIDVCGKGPQSDACLENGVRQYSVRQVKGVADMLYFGRLVVPQQNGDYIEPGADVIELFLCKPG